MRCSKCGVESRQTARFCDNCGSSLQPQCVSCGVPNRLGARFCDGCGASLTGSAAAAVTDNTGVRVGADIATSAELADGERKTVTALFADIKRLDGINGGPRPRGGQGDCRSGAQADDRRSPSLRRLYSPVYGRR